MVQKERGAKEREKEMEVKIESMNDIIPLVLLCMLLYNCIQIKILRKIIPLKVYKTLNKTSESSEGQILLGSCRR